MYEHKLIIRHPVREASSTALPDGAITGNGDVTVVLGGTADRVLLHIGKADFWKADGRAYAGQTGGISPLCTAELLLPHLAYADYEAVQDMDNSHIRLTLTAGNISAALTVTVCAEKNIVLLELKRTYPIVSVSASLFPREGCEAICEQGTDGDVTYAVRGFDTPACRFPTYGICAMRCISRTVSDGQERILWAVTVCTNHDSAAYKRQAIEAVRVLDTSDCKKLLAGHEVWWKNFWGKSGVELSDKVLENYWYAGLYAIVCCSGNKKFPPGLWGAYATSDGMNWFGDYHLNYNYEAPFCALTSCNHAERMECYASPLNDFLPAARRYAKEFLGIRGAYYPVAIGPLGLETDYRPDTKEHGHLFLGQKSNGAFAAVVPMLHWYGTRDREFAQREYYDYLLAVTEFWEDYLVLEGDTYQIYNDALREVGWFSGPHYMPNGQDDRNPLISCCLIRMLMGFMIDLSAELGRNGDRIEKWQHILDHLPPIETYEAEGASYLRCMHHAAHLDEFIIACVYPMGQIGKFITPDVYRAAQSTHRALAVWDHDNLFCSFYPAAARLGVPADEIIAHIHETIEKRGLPNGMFRFVGGGLENSSAIPCTINEMLLQSYENIIRLFPVWNRSHDAAFHGLRANGAFVVSARLKNGAIHAEILSECGRDITIESPAEGYTLVKGDGRRIPLTEPLTTVQTGIGERLKIVTD